MVVRNAAMTIAGAAVAAIFCGGCGSYDGDFMKPYRTGPITQAQTTLNQESAHALKVDPEKPNKFHSDKLVYLLEQGAMKRSAGDLQGSLKDLNEADRMIHLFESKASIRLKKETEAAMTNLAEIDYEGYGYDHIMLHTYAMLDYMELGKWEDVGVEVQRAAEAQDIVKANKKRQIEELEKQRQSEELKKQPQSTTQPATGFDANRAMSDPKVKSQLDSLYADLPQLSAEAVYTNPYTEYLNAICMFQLGDRSDRETAATAFRNVAGMCAGKNAYVMQDAEESDKAADGLAKLPVTYVILESGVAPVHESIRIDVPIFIYNVAVHDTGVDYFGVTFPKLKRQDGGWAKAVVVADGKTVETQPLVLMDDVIGKEFRDELPAVITRTIIAGGTKAVAAYAARKASGGGWAETLTRVGTTAYQAVMSQADLRSWRTLPKSVQIARVPTPADGQITVRSPDGTFTTSLTVQPKIANIVWVRNPGTAVYCRAFPVSLDAKPAKPSTQPVAVSAAVR